MPHTSCIHHAAATMPCMETCHHHAAHTSCIHHAAATMPCMVAACGCNQVPGDSLNGGVSSDVVVVAHPHTHTHSCMLPMLVRLAQQACTLQACPCLQPRVCACAPCSRLVNWARQADDLNCWPLPHMLHLVDKKFGGELLKADVLGVEVEEPDSDEDDGGPMGMMGHVSDQGGGRGGPERWILAWGSGLWIQGWILVGSACTPAWVGFIGT